MDARSEAAKLLGAIGGKKNFERHGREHMKRIGKLGGRPRKNKSNSKPRYEVDEYSQREGQ